MDIIARSIRAETLYYDVDSESFADKDSVGIYEISGRLKGEVILDNYLKLQGKTFDKNTEGYALPKKFEMSYLAFYNAIARSEISPLDVASKVLTKGYEEPTLRYKKTVIVSCSMNKALKETLDKTAKEEGITVSRLITKASKLYLDSKSQTR